MIPDRYATRSSTLTRSNFIFQSLTVSLEDYHYDTEVAHADSWRWSEMKETPIT